MTDVGFDRLLEMRARREAETIDKTLQWNSPARWSVLGSLHRISLVFSLPSPLPLSSSPSFRLCGATTMAEGAEVAVTVRTSPVDRRFPTTNQTKHCWARYLEFHACAAAKDADDPECAKFKRWYRSLCPEEWVEKWDTLREEGRFPGPE